MQKLILSFLIIVAFSVLIVFAGCSKDPGGNTNPPPVLDTIITVAGGNGGGSAANQLYYPYSIFVDSIGNKYVTDYLNCRIQKWVAGADSGITVAGGHGVGDSADQLKYPRGAYVDKNGNIYIADAGNNRIQKWIVGIDSGITVAGDAHGVAGTVANRLDNPQNVFVDANGNIYVTDYNNYRVQKFPSNSTSGTNGVTVAGGNGNGEDATHLDSPVGLFVDKNGNVYVSDDGNKERIQKFPAGSTSATGAVTVAGGNGNGVAANQLENPGGIYVDAGGNIYIADYTNHRIQKWAPNATTGITVAGSSAGTPGAAYNLFVHPTAVFLDASGKNLYISDADNHRIQEYIFQ